MSKRNQTSRLAPLGLVAACFIAAVCAQAPAAVYDIGDIGTFGLGEQWDSLSTGLSVNSTDDQYAASFTVFDAITIDRVWQRYVSVVGASTPIAVNIDIQTDSGGNPSGTSVASTLLNLAGNGAIDAVFSSPVVLTPGVYHVVTSSTDVHANRRFNIAASTGSNDIRPYDRRMDPALQIATRADGASAWTSDARDPFLVFGNGAPIGGPGQPYTTDRFDTFKTGDIVGGNVRSYGQRFVITDLEIPSDAMVQVSSIMMAAQANGSPTGDLVIHLRSADGAILATTSMAAAQADTTMQTLSLDQTVLLSEGVTYLLTTEYSGDGYYGLRSLSAPSNISGVGEATWGSVTTLPILSTDAWGTWQNSVPYQDLGFSFTGLVVVPEPGTLGLIGAAMALAVLRRGNTIRH